MSSNTESDKEHILLEHGTPIFHFPLFGDARLLVEAMTKLRRSSYRKRLTLIKSVVGTQPFQLSFSFC